MPKWSKYFSWSPDGQRVMALVLPEDGSPDCPALIMDVNTQKTVTAHEEMDCISSVRWSLDGNRILCASYNNKAFVYDSRTCKKIATLSMETGEYLRDAIWSPNSELILTENDASAVEIWSAATCQRIARFKAPVSSLDSPSFTRDSTRIIRLDNGPVRVQMWDAMTGVRLACLSADDSSYFQCAIISDDGQQITVADREKLKTFRRQFFDKWWGQFTRPIVVFTLIIGALWGWRVILFLRSKPNEGPPIVAA